MYIVPLVGAFPVGTSSLIIEPTAALIVLVGVLVATCTALRFLTQPSVIRVSDADDGERYRAAA